MGTLTYSITTAIFCLVIFMSGVGTLKSQKLIDDLKRMGFPDYFRKQLAISKIIGAMVLPMVFLPKSIIEWAYSGFFTLLFSAIVAHFSVKDSIKSMVLPLLLLILLAVSYYSFKQFQII